LKVSSSLKEAEDETKRKMLAGWKGMKRMWVWTDSVNDEMMLRSAPDSFRPPLLAESDPSIDRSYLAF